MSVPSLLTFASTKIFFKEANSAQRSHFCVFSGQGVNTLRQYLMDGGHQEQRTLIISVG